MTDLMVDLVDWKVNVILDLQVYLVHLMVDFYDGLEGTPDGKVDAGLDGRLYVDLDGALDGGLDGRLGGALDAEF